MQRDALASRGQRPDDPSAGFGRLLSSRCLFTSLLKSPMRRLPLLLLSVSLSAATLAAKPAEAETVVQKASGVAARTGKAVKKGLEKGEAAVEKAVAKTSDAVKTGAKKTGAAVRKGADRTGEFAVRVTRKARAAVTPASAAK